MDRYKRSKFLLEVVCQEGKPQSWQQEKCTLCVFPSPMQIEAALTCWFVVVQIVPLSVCQKCRWMVKVSAFSLCQGCKPNRKNALIRSSANSSTASLPEVHCVRYVCRNCSTACQEFMSRYFLRAIQIVCNWYTSWKTKHIFRTRQKLPLKI